MSPPPPTAGDFFRPLVSIFRIYGRDGAAAPGPFIDTGAVPHIADVLPNDMDSHRDSDVQTPEERRSRFSSAVPA
jgi:hypothetical protein